MKKPSTQIIDIMEGLQENPNNLGEFLLSSDQRMEVIRLCKVVDKRDQQLRKHTVKPKSKARR